MRVVTIYWIVAQLAGQECSPPQGPNLGMLHAGIKAEVMVTILERFGLSQPCNAPMLAVAYTSMHAAVVLAGVGQVILRGEGKGLYYEHDARIAKKHTNLCVRLFASSQKDLEGKQDNLCMPTEARGVAQGIVRAAVPQLQEVFGSFDFFLQLAGCKKSYEKMHF